MVPLCCRNHFIDVAYLSDAVRFAVASIARPPDAATDTFAQVALHPLHHPLSPFVLCRGRESWQSDGGQVVRHILRLVKVQPEGGKGSPEVVFALCRGRRWPRDGGQVFRRRLQHVALQPKRGRGAPAVVLSVCITAGRGKHNNKWILIFVFRYYFFFGFGKSCFCDYSNTFFTLAQQIERMYMFVFAVYESRVRVCTLLEGR